MYGMANSYASPSSLRPQAAGLIVGLTIQYLLGEFANIFIHFPDGQKGGQLWKFAWTQIPLALHIIIGFLLLFGAIVFFIRALVQKDRLWIFVSSLAGFVILEAVIAGAIFIPTQKDVYSYIMAVNFLIALFSLFWGIYATKKVTK